MKFKVYFVCFEALFNVSTCKFAIHTYIVKLYEVTVNVIESGDKRVLFSLQESVVELDIAFSMQGLSNQNNKL